MIEQQPQTLSLDLPSWVNSFVKQYSPTKEITLRMRFVIDAAMENVRQSTGGPFAAAVFESHSGVLIALGINLVTSAQLSIAHAEILALSLAQRHVGNFSLRGAKSPYQLVTSSEPCAMCLGAICWSGISSLVCGARIDDARQIGFDEGPISDQWQQALRERNVEVTTGVLTQEARQVLLHYRAGNGAIYNA